MRLLLLCVTYRLRELISCGKFPELLALSQHEINKTVTTSVIVKIMCENANMDTRSLIAQFAGWTQYLH